MKDFTLDDNTQRHIKQHLCITEQLIAEAATLVSGAEQSAQIYLMPDLGLPLNIRRMHGGFFTGALYSWTSSIPFVPVDATVNSCGVSVFRTSRDFQSKEEFNQSIRTAMEKIQNSSYEWNFASGNHFIIYCKGRNLSGSSSEGYLVLHSSASEFKNQFNGLYPVSGNWYSDKIKTIRSSTRYLRYIDGKDAERFIDLAQSLNKYNQIRHRFIADLIVNSANVVDEIVNVQHYGMPSANAIAIGCQWFYSPSIYLLLTAPDRPMYLVRTQNSLSNKINLDGQDCWLSPHGLGMRSLLDLSIKYTEKTLYVNNKEYTLSDRLEWGSSVEVRTFETSGQLPEIVEKVLEKCPGDIIGSLEPIYSYDRRDLLFHKNT